MSAIAVTFEVDQLKVEIVDGAAYVLAEESLMLPAVQLVSVLRELADQIELLEGDRASQRAQKEARDA